ncbi:hypothetical protein ALP23_102416 [Pseudomonas syringae pv. apii]|uniref:Uncharacterized protein n=2 Tax=Pseudomonas syringae group TaxID=136849 RepID=A0A3M5WKD1_9PSED|nr:hypothetical protein ALO91_103196 [Pseudomonas syringae pv. aceris]RMR50856.1 hypothetical protein ALP85_102476 [Pseudomonas syringae pv. syringae]RMU70105.1 hypothetical protein ALP23_102416 [Pseudomonas syringae pv. apii]
MLLAIRFTSPFTARLNRIIKRKPVIDGLFSFSAFASDVLDGIRATRFLDL